MFNKTRLFLLLLAVCTGTGFAQEVPQKLVLPSLDKSPAPANFSLLCEKLPQKQPAKLLAPAELDVRACDISSWDLRDYTSEELADVLTFDSQTKFPPKAKLPKNFSAKKILKNGKNPGLGIKKLHKKGITGKGVSAAIIDQNLLTTHQEYAKQLVWYEENEWWHRHGESSMHAPAVASILAGKTTGVAPQVRLFLFAPELFGRSTKARYDAAPTAYMLRRIIQLNKQLPDEKRIRVVSISRGFQPDDFGAADFSSAKKELEESGVAVFTTNDVFTLNRTHSLANPDKAEYCRPAYWWNKNDIPLYNQLKEPTVPTDFRAVAAPNGNKDYVHYANGGLSWAVPYVAGLYALGVQVKPTLTKAEFLKAVADTSNIQTCSWNGQPFTAQLVNPQRLVEYLQK